MLIISLLYSLFIAAIFLLALIYSPPKLLLALASTTGIIAGLVFLVIISTLSTGGDGPPSSGNSDIIYFWLGMFIAISGFIAMLASLRFQQKVFLI